VVKKHFCQIFMGTNPPEKLLQLLQSFHIDVRVDRFASGLSAHCIVSGVTAVDGRPERRSGTCPALVLTMPVDLPNGWRCLYPLLCLYRLLLSFYEYLRLIRFLPEETQLLLCV
jgi:hypothetical protein